MAIIKSFIEKFKGSYFYQEEEISVKKAQEILNEARFRIGEAMRVRSLLEVMAHTITGAVWIKSFDILTEQHTYEFANRNLCENFFCFDAECLEDCTLHVKNRSDSDLINAFIEKTKSSHTFSDLCEETDIHAVDQAIRYYHTNGKDGAKSSRYLEFGTIGNRSVLFTVIKTPLFAENEKPCWNTHTYLVGTATEETMCCDIFYEKGKSLIQEGKATVICPGAVWIHPITEHNVCTLLEKDLKEGQI